MSDKKDGIIAASPIVREPNRLPRRIVIRDSGDGYVVQGQIFDLVVPDLECDCESCRTSKGDYFPYDKTAGTSLALGFAWMRFEERVRLTLNLSRPGKSAEDIANIAETIINSLLPEDRDDQEDLWSDYQFESDVETFEHFTGKTIRPVKEEVE